MGDLSTWDHYETYGGWPDPGEAHPSLEAADNLRKREREEGVRDYANERVHHHRTLTSTVARGTPPEGNPSSSSGGRTVCGCCGAPADAKCSPPCETNRG